MSRPVTNLKLNPNELRIIDTAIAHPELTSYKAIGEAAGVNRSYLSNRAKQNPVFREELEKAFARRSEKIAEKAAKQVCDFDPIRELAEMAKSWKASPFGLNASHVRAAELYMHARGETPEAKKIMAEIYGKMNAAEFYGWNQDELTHYVRTGERPARLSAQSGSASVN